MTPAQTAEMRLTGRRALAGARRDVASKLLRLEPEGDDVIAAYDRLT